jgi:hypothetical protein
MDRPPKLTPHEALIDIARTYGVNCSALGLAAQIEHGTFASGHSCDKWRPPSIKNSILCQNRAVTPP